MRKAYSYIRMSTDIQLKGDSLRRQLEASKKYAFDNKLELVESIDGVELKDIGVSAFKGANAEKGALSIFLQLLENGKIEKDSILLIESLDRLSRDKITSSLARFMDILEKGIEIVTLIDGQTYTKEKLNKEPSSLFISLGVMIRANEESETKSNRLSAAWQNKRNNAATKVVTRTLPAWIKYNETTKKLEPINERAKIVKGIFQMCIETCGMLGIAKFLNESKVPLFGKGKIWYRSYISKILNNRAVLGEFQPHKFVDGKRQPEGDSIPDYFPRIVDEHTFHLAHAQVDRRNKSDKGRKGKSFVNILSGIAYCGNCGSKMSARNRGKKSAKKIICMTQKEGGTCSSNEWDMIIVENRVIKHLREVDFGALLEMHEPITKSLQDEVSSLKERLKGQEKTSELLMDLLQDSELVASAKQKYRSRLNVSEELSEKIKSEIQQKEVELSAELELSNKIDTSKLKEFLSKFESHNDDYFFRSSINQLIAKTINRIEFHGKKNAFNPWEFNESDTDEFANGAAERFRKQNPELAKLSMNKLVKLPAFKRFVQMYDNKIIIQYKSGTTQRVLLGDDISF